MSDKVPVANLVEIAIRAFRAVVEPRATGSVASSVPATGKAGPGSPGPVAAPFAGVVPLTVDEGDTVEAGRTVATIRAGDDGGLDHGAEGRHGAPLAVARSVEDGDLLLVVE